MTMVAGYNQRIVTFSNIVTFGTEDQCVYDPCNMRSYVVSNAHVGVSIPEPYRSRGHSGMMTFHIHYEGTFAGASATNGIKFYVKQYRGAGVFLRDLVLGTQLRNLVLLLIQADQYLLQSLHFYISFVLFYVPRGENLQYLFLEDLKMLGIRVTLQHLC